MKYNVRDMAKNSSTLFTPRLVKVAVIAAIGSMASTPILAAEVSAQVQNEDQVERIIVTGTRRNDRTVSESNVPIDVININDMVTTGQLEVSQILSTLIPSFNYPHSSIADGTDHARPAVLRGLAPDHTLVLINGKRVTVLHC